MNKKQLITMWVGILLASLAWLNWDWEDLAIYIPIITVITGGLIISFSDNNYKSIKEFIEFFNNYKNKKPKDEQK